MKNTLLFFSLILFAACYNHDAATNKPLFKADLDTTYSNGSGISTISPDSVQLHNLTNLGMLWGFLKYYHAAVNKGNYNMDAELFRVLPNVLAAHNVQEANNVMEQWVNHFGIPDTCTWGKTWPNGTRVLPDYGYLFDNNNFQPSLIRKLKFIKDNRDTNWTHYYIAINLSSAGNPIFTHEISYDKNFYPDAGLRLLALYRYWNIIQYFCPNRHLIGEDWNKVLKEFIPSFCNATDVLAYQMACMRLIARIHDTHAQLDGSYAIEKTIGNYYMPFKVAFIEGKLVVTGYYSDTAATIMKQVQLGDIIVKIGFSSVDSLVKKYLPLVSASNYTQQLHLLSRVNGWLTTGTTENIYLQLLRNGLPVNEIVKTSDVIADNSTGPFPQRPSIMFGNIGYIYPALLNDHDLDSLKQKFKHTDGIIIDMRCYPGTFMPYTYGAWLKPSKSAFGIASVFNVNTPGWFGELYTLYNGTDTGEHYKGKLVIIVNEETLSQAEFTTMALSTVPGAIVVGDTTAGADGNVSKIPLPGGLSTQISGIGQLYPDGTETQRVGVRIDHFIAPTIAGIKAKRDEQLEYAIKWINGK